jgi:hypothetical protein
MQLLRFCTERRAKVELPIAKPTPRQVRKFDHGDTIARTNLNK